MAARHGPHTMNHRLLKAVATGDAGLLAQILGEEGHESILRGVTAEGSCALHIAASRGYLDLVAMIHTQDSWLIMARNYQRETPLLCASRAGHADVVRYLIEQDFAYPVWRAVNSAGATAMHEAIRNGHASVVQELMSRDSELAAMVDGEGASPLYLAVVSNQVEMVDILIRESPDGVKSPASYSGPDGQTALHAAVFVSKEMSESILRWEPTISKKVDTYGRTALHYAASAGKTGVVKLLLTTTMLAYVSDNDGLFPVHMAAMAGRVGDICELMEICPCCDELLDNKCRNILHCAVEHARDTVIRHICRNPKFAGLMNARDCEGNTPLHLAVKHGHLLIFCFLMMDSRVNLGILNNERLTPLNVVISERTSNHSYSSFKGAFIMRCLELCEASCSSCRRTMIKCSDDQVESSKYTNTSILLIGCCVLGALFSVRAVFTPHTAFIAKGENSGMRVYEKTTGFWILMTTNSMSFLLYTVAACALLAGQRSTHLRCRCFCLMSAHGLFLGAFLFMIISFMTDVAFTLDPANNSDNFWPILNLAVPVCSWTAVLPWRKEPRIPEIVGRVSLHLFLGVSVTLTLIFFAINKFVPGDIQQSCSWPECVLQGDANLSYPT